MSSCSHAIYISDELCCIVMILPLCLKQNTYHLSLPGFYVSSLTPI